jgi:crotonobetainyl-CoA:carnitine CoA-transferase CaiB-like acyl-CoA transferase
VASLESLLEAGGLALPADCIAAAGAPEGAEHHLELVGGDPVLPAAFPIGEAAAAALLGGAGTAARLLALRGAAAQHARVDVRAAAASLLGFAFQSVEASPADGDARPVQTARIERPTSAIYPTADGRHIHLHGGFPHLAEGTLRLLGCEDEATSVASAVSRWKAQALEDALAERGLCGAMIRTPSEWTSHPQGGAVSRLAAIEIERVGEADPEPLPAGPRPLSGVRNLDLTRVLAGPTSGRTLAFHGADVLRIGAPHLPTIEPFVIDTGHGKRAAHLDLRVEAEAERLRALVREADVVTDGYRNGGLAGRGLSAEALVDLRPGLVIVSLSCYGDVGPWAERRGWEQLAQSASGIAHVVGGDAGPRLLPAAATDYTTGYLAAWGAMEALRRRATQGGSWLVRVSLCQTASWLLRLGARLDPKAASGVGNLADLQQTSETPWGRLRHLRPPLEMSPCATRWSRPTVPVGYDAAEWLPR